MILRDLSSCVNQEKVMSFVYVAFMEHKYEMLEEKHHLSSTNLSIVTIWQH